MFLLILGVLFVVAAAAVPVVAPSVAQLGFVWAAVGLLLLAIGVSQVTRRRFRTRVLAEGLAGTAEITSVTQTRMQVNNQPIMVLRLTVTVPDRPPYEARVRQLIPFVLLVRAQPGKVVAVRIDPDKPDRPVIDWNAPAVSPAAG
jgi:hypothetical protein